MSDGAITHTIGQRVTHRDHYRCVGTVVEIGTGNMAPYVRVDSDSDLAPSDGWWAANNALPLVPSGVAAMLAKLDAYVAARLAEGVDMDPDYNQAQGAAAALRYALTGGVDATLSNLLGNVEEGA